MKNYLIYILISILFLSTSSKANQIETIEDKKYLNKENVEISNKRDSYIVGPGDVLYLSFFEPKDLSRELIVLNDGTISIPMYGNIYIEELTISQAKEKVQSKLGEIFINPQIQLSLTSARPMRISVIGEVKRPGIYSFGFNKKNSSSSNRPAVILPTLVDAIQEAGGITPDANFFEIHLSRKLPSSNKNFYKRTKIDLFNLITNGFSEQNPYLFDGDIVKIQKKSIEEKLKIKIAESNLAANTINVNFIGEIIRPGKLELDSNTPLIEGILAAGGPLNWRANRGNVKLIRLDKKGTVQISEFRINLNENISKKSNPLLKHGDTVFLQRTKLAKSNDALNAVADPASKIVNIWTLLRLLNNN